MKHFGELNALELEIIRIAELRNLLSVLNNGADRSTLEEIASSLWYIQGSLDDISQQLDDRFKQLWGAIAADKDVNDQQTS
jgi:hypothetical protein